MRNQSRNVFRAILDILPSMGKTDDVLYDQQTEFAYYRVVDTVYDNRPAIVLYGDNNSSQAGIAKDDNPELLFDYNQRFLELARSTKPKKVLLIGGGGFTLPTALLGAFKSIFIDVVELDPALEPIARQYFGLPNNPNLHIFNQDGWDFIDKNKKTYDFIVVDAFSGYEIPPQLITPEAARRYRASLSEGGVFAINFISAYRRFGNTLASQLQTIFRKEFSNVDLYSAAKNASLLIGPDNLILVAYEGDFQPFEHLHSTLIASDSRKAAKG